MQRLKSLIGVLVVLSLFYVAWMVFPPYYNNFQLQDAIESEARVNSYNTRTEQDIHDGLMKKVQDLEIPMSPNQLHVQRNGGELRIWGEYTVRVDLPGYPIDLHFEPSTKNKRIM